jgi:hypothetical protein
MFYAIYRTADGKLVSQSTVDPVTVPANLTIKSFASDPTPGYVWDAPTLDFIPRPLQARSLLSRNEFWKRFTPTELVDIEEGSFSYSADTAGVKRKKAEVRAAMRLWVALDPLDLTANYVTVPMASIVSAGVLTQARADAILAPAME